MDADASSSLVSRSSRLSSSLRRSSTRPDDVRHEILGEPHVVVEVEVRGLRLDHPEFGEMTAGLGFLGAKRRPEAVDLAERERAGLGIELSALREIRLALAEVVDLEEIGGAFA